MIFINAQSKSKLKILSLHNEDYCEVNTENNTSEPCLHSFKGVQSGGISLSSGFHVFIPNALKPNVSFPTPSMS